MAMQDPIPLKRRWSDHVQHDHSNGERGLFHPLYADNYNPGSILRPNYLVTLVPYGKLVDKPRYRGDIYDDKPTDEAKAWAIETARYPYLNRIRKALPAFPSLRHLVSWMEVSTSATRYIALSQAQSDRPKRLQKVQVCQVDLNSGLPPIQTHKATYYSDKTKLREALDRADSSSYQPDARVYVIEDLSTEILEIFGEKYGIDPYFWRSHIDDYLWNLPSAETTEIRSLDLVIRQRPYFTMRYLRPRYYRDTAMFEQATREMGEFNVLRQLDSDRGRQSIQDKVGAGAALMRAKASMWIKPRKSQQESVLAIILIDPTPSTGYRLWGGYDSFEDCSIHADPQDLPRPQRETLYNDVLYWMSRLTAADISSIAEEPKTCAMPAIKLILSDWHHVLQYVTSQLGQIEWEIEIREMRKQKSGIEATMQKLHPWRRNMSLYRTMVAESIDRIYSKETQRQYATTIPKPDQGLPSLLPDFKHILDEIDRIQQRIERIVSVASALLSIEEGRRAQKQNSNVARLTYLATIFIPLSFVSGFLSMSPDLSQLGHTIKVFWWISIPLTAIALFVAIFGEKMQEKFDDIVQKLKEEREEKRKKKI